MWNLKIELNIQLDTHMHTIKSSIWSSTERDHEENVSGVIKRKIKGRILSYLWPKVFEKEMKWHCRNLVGGGGRRDESLQNKQGGNLRICRKVWWVVICGGAMLVRGWGQNPYLTFLPTWSSWKSPGGFVHRVWVSTPQSWASSVSMPEVCSLFFQKHCGRN